MYVDAFGYSLMKALAQWDWESIFMPKHSSICMGGMSNKMYNDTHSTGINASFQTWSRMQHFSDPWGYSAYDVGYGTRFFYSGTSSNYSYLRDGTFVCFVAGTPVLAESGQKAIEDIAPGDYVWATNEKTGETSLKEVVRVFVNETNELIHVTINGETISCTKEHPFYSPVKGWISACNLKSGDILVTVNGEYVVIEKVQHELLEAAVKVYNFEVEEYHTYYVGTQCILVHNDCGAKYEIHHVVERCQQKKSGFGKDKIENPFNKVPIEYSIHRRISAYYSSKQFYTNGLRVRDWLAGQSFDEQTRFGWKIIRMYLEE